MPCPISAVTSRSFCFLLLPTLPPLPLDISFYDQELLEKIAAETGFSKEFIEEAAEYSTAKNSPLFNLVMNRSLHGRTEPFPADTIYFEQQGLPKTLQKEKAV